MSNFEQQIANHRLLTKMRLDSMWKALKTPTFSGFKLMNRYSYKGLQISIENAKGSTRSWKDDHGNEGKTKMTYDYGYIRRTVGNDGDHIDCYIDSKNDSEKVFVIHQMDPETNKFDEDKVMLGFSSASQAKTAYLAHYNSPKFFGSMDEMNIKDFKKKVIGKIVKKVK